MAKESIITTWKHKHPGAGKKRSRIHPKGRQVDPEAHAQVYALLQTRPRRRDLLIEHLHLIQDHYGCLSAAHLAALAEEMHMALAEVFEVATFYAHFDVLRDGEASLAAVTVRVCDSLSCEMAGAEQLLTDLTQTLGAEVRVIRAPCMGGCDKAPVVSVGHHQVEAASVDKVTTVITQDALEPELPAYISYDAYTADGGYSLLRECCNGARTVADVIDVLNDADLRGLGGAGFPTGRKWDIVRSYAGPRLMAINADEGEPGTFKDRYYLERDPHRFLEGVLIAAWAVEAETCYIYLRDEYPAVRQILLKEIARIETEQLSPDCRIELRRGAGAYICGEESAMLESIEGKRGLPRNRPPYVAEVGLFGRPTLVQNVETLYWIQDLLQKGPDWFTREGRNGHKGLRSFSVSGRVKEPGVKLAPAGITLRELLDEYCGGMAEGHNLKGYLPGGASGGILPASMADIPLDFGTLEQHGCFIGSAAVVVLSDQDNIRNVAVNLMRFFADESCGQCTPCRVGCEKAVDLIEQPEWDAALLNELSQAMTDASICGLGQAASNPLKMALKHFQGDIICR